MANAPLGDPMRVLGTAYLDDSQAILNLIEALRIAETAARQLAFTRNQPQWLTVQNNVARMRDIVATLGRVR